MKKFLLTSALVAASAASFAQEAKQSDAMAISAFDESINMTVADDAQSEITNPVPFYLAKPSLENETWYSIPGLYHRSFTKYSEDSGSTGGGGYSTYNAPLISVPIDYDIIFKNECTDKVNSQWGFNNDYFGQEGLFDENNDGLRAVSKHSGSSYYVPMVKVGENVFYWGEEGYTSNSITCDSICALSYDEKGTNISMYTGFSGNVYCFGTASTEFDFDKDGTKETVYQYAVEQSYPKPQAPVSFDYIFLPALTYNADGMFFKDGAKIKLQVISDATNQVLWEAEAGQDDFLNGIGAFTNGGNYGNLKFQKVEKDEDGGEYTVNCTLNEAYTIVISGFQNAGVDLGFRMIKRSTYGAKALLPVVRYYQDAEGKAVGSLTWTANTYGLPLQLHGLYDVMSISDEYVASSGKEMKDMNVLTIAADGQSATAGNSSLGYAQAYTQMDWYDAEGNENYFAELPEWVTSMVAAMSETAKSGYVQVAFKAEALPAGVTGRGAKVYLESFMGGKAEKPIYLLQGDYTKEMVDQATGIEAIAPVIKSNKAITVNAIGQRVAANAKGLVIKNGVKVFNK